MEISPKLFEKKRKNQQLQTKRKTFPKHPRKNRNRHQNQEQNAPQKQNLLKELIQIWLLCRRSRRRNKNQKQHQNQNQPPNLKLKGLLKLK